MQLTPRLNNIKSGDPRAKSGIAAALNSKLGNKQTQPTEQDNVKAALERTKKNDAAKLIKNVASVAAGGSELAGKMAETAATKTELGDKMLSDAAKESSTPEETAAKFFTKFMQKINAYKIGLQILAVVGPIAILILMIFLQFAKADSQQFSANDGNRDVVEQDRDVSVLIDSNVFTKYQDLYDKVNEVARDYHNKYGLEIDKNLIIATLTAPIENDSYGYGEKLLEEAGGNWNNIVSRMKFQIELLAKYQITTVHGSGSESKGSDRYATLNMQRIARNDDGGLIKGIWWSIMDAFGVYNGLAAAEQNNKYYLAPRVSKPIKVISTEEGRMELTYDQNGNIIDPNENENIFGYTGSIYYWNLINEAGFIYEYYQNLLNVNKSVPEKMNYLNNLPVILDTVSYIYSYKRGLDDVAANVMHCDNYKIYEDATISEVHVKDKGTFDLETYVAGVIVNEFPQQFSYFDGNSEAMKAFAILARTYALSIVGADGHGEITASSQHQNFSPNGINVALIKEAVEATRGLILAEPSRGNNGFRYYGDSTDNEYEKTLIKYIHFMGEYDAFCPTTEKPVDGYYYLTSRQKSLPISLDFVQGWGLDQPKYVDCPCSYKETPGNSIMKEVTINYYQNLEHERLREIYGAKFAASESKNPFPYGIQSETTGAMVGQYAKCWTPRDNVSCDNSNLLPGEKPYTVENCPNERLRYTYFYNPSGGHGRGASQFGLRYFAEKGYTMEELLKLFYSSGSAGSSNRDQENNAEFNTRNVQIMRIKSSLNNDGTCTYPISEFTEAELFYSAEVRPTNDNSVTLTQSLEIFLDSRGSTFEEYRNLVEQKAKDAGLGTREAVVEVARAMIQSLDESYNVKIPYQYFGGHDKTTMIIDPNWGESIECYDGNGRCIKGLDNSGFVNTVLTLAGFNITSKTSNEWGNVGTKTSITEGKALKGDLIWHNNTVMIVLDKTEKGYYVAYAKSGLDGIVIEEVQAVDKTFTQPNYIVDMTNFYRNSR